MTAGGAAERRSGGAGAGQCPGAAISVLGGAEFRFEEKRFEIESILREDFSGQRGAAATPADPLDPPLVMETEERPFKDESKETCFQIFKDFMTRVAKLEELWSVGSRLLIGFQQGLEFLRRPPVNGKSELIDNIIKANETARLKSYIAAGCINNHDSVQNISKWRSIIKEIENLLLDYSVTIKTRNRSLSILNAANLDQQAADNQEETQSSDKEEFELTDLAALMGIIYSMLKQDFVMQEKIVASLNLKSSPGELESYCLMWSLRPYVNDELMRQAWRHIH